jgi:hypothetical protein
MSLQLAALNATLATLVAALQSAFMLKFLWASRDAIETTNGLGQVVLLPLALRLAIALAGAITFFAIFSRNQTFAAKWAIYLHAMLFALLGWSVLSHFTDSGIEQYSRLGDFGKVAWFVVRVAWGIWLALVTKELWGLSFSSHPKVSDGA